MADSNKKSEKLEPGMYNCTMVKDAKDKRIYHSSTAMTLRDKGILKVGEKIEKYQPKGMVS